MSDKNIEKAKKLFLEKGLTYAAIASLLSISSRTVERWASKGNWKLLRDTEELASVALAEEVSSELAKPIPAKSVRVALAGLSRKEIFEAAIASLHTAAPDAAVKSQEAAYGQLIKIMEAEQRMRHHDRMADLEYKLKEADLILKQRQINPLTIEELADMAIELGYSLKSFIEAMRARQKTPQA